MTINRILGVLGGMGPLASAHFMLRLTILTPAERDQDHIPTILWSDPRVPDRTRSKLADGDDPLPWLLRGIRGLRQAGAEAIAIPCNTAHGWFAEMQAEAACPILHIIEAAAADLRHHGIKPGRIGVMATAGTLAMRFYQDRLEAQGWISVTPNADQMDRLVTPAIALVKANRITEAYEPFVEAARSLARQGARAIVLGCTEIPLAMRAGPSETLGLPLIDTIDALARAAIRWATRTPLPLGEVGAR